MPSSNSSKSGQIPIPLIVPKSGAAVATTSSSSFNIFRMILNDGHRAKLAQPVVDLESEAANGIGKAVTGSPDAKRKKCERKDLEVEPDETDVMRKRPSVKYANNLPSRLKDVKGLSDTVQSQGGEDIIDLTNESVSDSDSIVKDDDYEDDVICMDDLTVLDDEITIVEDVNTCTSIERIPSVEDALSKGTTEFNGITARFWERFTVAPAASSRSTEMRICSYNVLCQLTSLKTMHLYTHLGGDDSVLEWENRWRILEEELTRLNADIFGLQEVQYDHFDSHFKPSFSKAGYASYYKRRTGLTYDGCAVLVRKSMFEVVSYRIVEYFIAHDTTMDRDQIGQILRLRCKKTKQEFIYANTHLIFNTARGDIKIGQLAVLIANIQDELTKSRCPVILSGDFNIEPLSHVYTYISESSVYLRGLPRNELSGQGNSGGPCVNADNILPSTTNIGRDSMFIDRKAPRKAVSTDYFTHPLRLASVYHHFNEDGEKEVSTYHKDVGNPDYLFYSIEKKMTTGCSTHVYEVPELRLLQRLSLPGRTVLDKTCGRWPNRYVPSDHIPLVADFLLSKTDRFAVIE